ncbi:DUF3383 family protein [Archaeoglobus profundus]|uniref:Uncharacterized protein n=1 Tax=Archaeoglobus profundus (strain DSM 5631 / JCM 9629 / NBRC 100127 / Av18) TaxID=572546 RepID=D2REJ6_ARCPA|nr:DUF3383 family protein [Archaeoglobus profundus]ADB58540.1 hypothetical protein Arcpr_1493 [Archaeoglobus profundus DSM 5631]
MPTAESAITINLQDATFAAPSETYGEVIVIGEDPNKLDLFNQVKTYYSQSEVEADFGPDSPISKATAKVFAQGVQRVKAVNAMKDDGTGNAVADYDTVLADLEDKKVDYDIMVATIDASDANASKLVNHAGTYHKVLVLASIGDAATVTSNFLALTANEYVFAVAHDDTNLTPGELSGAIAGVISKLQPWIPCEWYNVQGVNAAGYKASEVDQLEQNNIATIIEIGKAVISTAKSLDGSWIDVPRTKAYLVTEIRNALINLKLKLANMGSKIPYTPQGLSMIKATIEKVLRVAQAQRALREDYVDANGNLVRGYEVQMPNYDDISDSDKAARILKNVKVTAYLSGAISKITLDLIITL